VLCLYESGTRLARKWETTSTSSSTQRERRSPWSEARTFRARIRRNIRLAEAPSFGQSIFQYAPDSNGAEDYVQLAEEVLARARSWKAPTDNPAPLGDRDR